MTWLSTGSNSCIAFPFPAEPQLWSNVTVHVTTVTRPSSGDL